MYKAFDEYVNTILKPELEKVNSDIGFEPVSHTYNRHGIIYPSVTTIMKPLTMGVYGNVDEKALKAAAERGTAVHEALEMCARYGVEEELPPERQGYFEAWKRWRENYNPEFIASETKVYHNILLYAGAVDAICAIDDETYMVDYKTTVRLETSLTNVQLAAYDMALRSHDIEICKFAVLKLKSDGGYTFQVKDFYDLEGGREIFEMLYKIRQYAERSRRI